MCEQLKIWTGCSGFYNRHWKGIFYPENLPQKDWFKFYAAHLPALELNATFYRFPTQKLLEKWYEGSPTRFLFAVKVPQIITHFKRLNDCKSMLDDFYRTCGEALREKLACILFQFPPSFIFSPAHLMLILQNCNSEFRNVCEFRHISWWNPQVIESLSVNGIVFCNVSHPSLPDQLNLNGDTAYIRIHGDPVMFHSPYPMEKQQWLLGALSGETSLQNAFVFFNNTAGESGKNNALEFSRGVEARCNQ